MMYPMLKEVNIYSLRSVWSIVRSAKSYREWN